MPITGLNHAVLFVRDLERSLDFYKTVLGFIEVDRVQNQMGFLRAASSSNHHDLGLIAIGASAATPKPGTVGLYHLAWQVPTIEDLVTAAQVLQQAGYLRGASDHGVSKSLYGEDPDGNGFELLWCVPRDAWGEFAQRAVTRSLNLAQELERFGQQTTQVTSS
jgi:catechol-2,3-dioxygenase